MLLSHCQQKNIHLFCLTNCEMNSCHNAKRFLNPSFFLFILWVTFSTKKSLCCFWSSKRNANLWWNWVFGSFLAIWLRGIFQTWPENKKEFFFWHKHHSLLMVQSILVDGKISCISIPNLFWNILLLWSTGGDLNGCCFEPFSRSTFRFC